MPVNIKKNPDTIRIIPRIKKKEVAKTKPT